MSNSDKLRLGFVSDGKLLVKFAFVQGQASEVVVGRSSSAQVCINNNVVSSQHAQLIYDANGNLHIIDMNSSNGTFLNDRKLVCLDPFPSSSKKFESNRAEFGIYSPPIENYLKSGLMKCLFQLLRMFGA